MSLIADLFGGILSEFDFLTGDRYDVDAAYNRGLAEGYRDGYLDGVADKETSGKPKDEGHSGDYEAEPTGPAESGGSIGTRESLPEVPGAAVNGGVREWSFR